MKCLLCGVLYTITTSSSQRFILYSLQSILLVIGSYCLGVSLFHTDNVWAENDLDLVDYNDAVARMNLARGF